MWLYQCPPAMLHPSVGMRQSMGEEKLWLMCSSVVVVHGSSLCLLTVSQLLEILTSTSPICFVQDIVSLLSNSRGFKIKKLELLPFSSWSALRFTPKWALTPWAMVKPPVSRNAVLIEMGVEQLGIAQSAQHWSLNNSNDTPRPTSSWRPFPYVFLTRYYDEVLKSCQDLLDRRYEINRPATALREVRCLDGKNGFNFVIYKYLYNTM